MLKLNFWFCNTFLVLKTGISPTLDFKDHINRLSRGVVKISAEKNLETRQVGQNCFKSTVPPPPLRFMTSFVNSPSLY